MPDTGQCSFIGNDLHRPMWQKIVSGMRDGIPRGLHLIIWDWTWREDHQRIHDRFPFDAYMNLIGSHPRLKPVLLIDSMNEAPQYHLHIAPLVDWLDGIGVTPRGNVIHCTGGVLEEHGVRKIISNGAFALGHHDNDMPSGWDHHFVMLSRVPKPLRAICTSEVLLRGLDGNGYISCGVNTHASVDRAWIDLYVPHGMRHRFPLSIDDGAIEDFSHRQFAIGDARISNAAVNVVTETSQDPQLEVRDPLSVWNDVFITEKTAKAFRLLQLPIWAGVCGTVDEVRRMGFDVFDDVIDHGYDSERDPYARMSMVADQLRRLCELSMQELNDMRGKHWDRLLHNRRRADDISIGLLDGLASKLEESLRVVSGRSDPC